MFATLTIKIPTFCHLIFTTRALQFHLITCTVHFNCLKVESLNTALLAFLTGILEVWQQLYLLMLYIFISFYTYI